MKIFLKIEVITKTKNYNLTDRDKGKIEKRTKREKAEKPVIGITTWVTLCIYTIKIVEFFSEYFMT